MDWALKQIAEFQNMSHEYLIAQMCVDFLIYAGKALLMGTKKTGKQKWFVSIFQPRGYLFVLSGIHWAGKPAHWLLGKLMAARKDAVS